MSISLGVGLTNDCNCNCEHCYSRTEKTESINYQALLKFCNKYDISAVNFGTGESYLYSDFNSIIHFFSQRNIPMSVTTNGYTAEKVTYDELALFNDIDFSLDYPSRKQHNEYRKGPRYESIINGIKRCKEIGVECSIAFCLMKSNARHLKDMLDLCRKLNVNLRINVYKPVHKSDLRLSYTEFWDSIKVLLIYSKWISCSEPIVNAALKEKKGVPYGSPCGSNSLRIKPNGNIVSCVYLSTSKYNIYDLCNKTDFSEKELLSMVKKQFTEKLILPQTCIDCNDYDYCKGGCESRRILTNNTGIDEFCFVNKAPLSLPEPQWCKDDKSLVHSSYLCTIIVKP